MKKKLLFICIINLFIFINAENLNIRIVNETASKKSYYEGIESDMITLSLRNEYGKTVGNVKWYEVKQEKKWYNYGEKVLWDTTILNVGNSFNIGKFVGTRFIMAKSIINNLITCSDVFRISLRENKYKGDLIDYLTMFEGVTYMYGSNEKTINSFAGIDCQDLIIFGLRKMKNEISYNRHIHNEFSDKKIFEGWITQNARIKDIYEKIVSIKIKRGDIIRLIDYAGKGHGHYLALYEDNGTVGVLDKEDVLIHTPNDGYTVGTRTVENEFNWMSNEDKVKMQVFRF